MDKIMGNKKAIFIFIFPALLFFIVILLIPIAYNFYLSTFRWVALEKMVFTGFTNYIKLFKDPVFLITVRNNLSFVGLAIVFQLPLALIISIVLSKKIPMVKLFKATYFMPNVISGVAVSMLWRFIYHPRYGPINELLNVLGNPNASISLLDNAKLAIYSIAIIMAWQGIGYYMLIYLSGIQAIPIEIYEAARIDGSNEKNTLFSITLPLMWPMIKISFVLITVSTLKVFDFVYVLTNGGPNHASEVMTSYIYTTAIARLNMGYGATIGVAMFAICLAFSLIIMRVFKRETIEF